MHHDLPRSLVSAERGAQAAVWFAGAVTMTELLLLSPGVGACVLFIITMFPPIVALGFVVRPLVRGEWRKVALVTLVALAVHAFVGVVIAMGHGASFEVIRFLLVVIAALFAAVTIAAVPIFVAGVALSARRDLEAGDAMLGWGGAWLVGLQTLALVLASDRHDEGTLACVLVTIAGLAVGLLALGTFAGRAIARRRWCARVLRGDLQGWRVRENTSTDELAKLPPIFGSPRNVSGVLERIEMGGALYRSGLVASPVAAIRVRAELRPGASLSVTP